MTIKLVDRYTLEANFGSFFGTPLWYDLTPYVLGGLTTTRGRQDEQSTPVPGVLKVDLVNDDGRFTPQNTASPYYPYVVDGAPIRVTARLPVGDNYEDNSSHEGSIAEWSTGGFGTAPTVALSTTHVYADGGQWAMLITWSAGTTFANANRTLYGLTVGQRYTASRYVWVPTGSPAVQLNVTGFSPGAASAVNDAWTRVSVTFTATSTSHVLQVASTTTGAGQCWTDAGNVAEGAAPGSTLTAAKLLPRYYGFAAQWPMRWDGVTGAAVTSLAAVDVLDRPARVTIAPFDVEEAKLDAPTAYLPLDEPAAATQAGNIGSWVAAGVPVQVGGGGTYQFAAATGPPADGTSALVLTPASSTSGWYLRVPTYLGVATQFTLEAFINSTTASTTLLDLSSAAGGSTGTNGITLAIDASKKLKLTTDVGGLVVTSPSVVADGTTRHVAATYVQDGVNHTTRLYVDGALVQTGSVASAATGLGGTYLTIGGGTKLGLYTGTISHVGLYATALSAARLKAHRDAGVTGFGGETSDLRISRLAAYAGLSSLTAAVRTGVGVWDDTALGLWDSTMIWAGSDLNLEPGYAMVYGQADGGLAVSDAMNNVATTEGGVLLADRSGKLQLQNRQHRYNRPAITVISVSDDVDPGLTPAYDTQQVANDVTATTQDQATVRAVDTTSAASPPTGRGRYSATLQLLTRDLSDAWSAASWRVSRYGAPRLAYRQATVNLGTLPDDQCAALLAVDVGDRFDLTGLPANVPSSTAQLVVEGYTETVGLDGFGVQYTTTDAALSQVLVWDTSTWDATASRWAW